MRYILYEQDRWPREQITAKSGFPASPVHPLGPFASSSRRFVASCGASATTTMMVGHPERRKGPNQQIDLRVQSWNAGSQIPLGGDLVHLQISVSQTSFDLSVLPRRKMTRSIDTCRPK